jgi:hypothetical protein
MRWWAGPKMIRPTSFWFRDFGIRTAKPGSCPLRLDPTSPTSVCDSWWPWGLRRWKMSTGQADFLQKLHTILYRYTMIYYDILIYIYIIRIYMWTDCKKWSEDVWLKIFSIFRFFLECFCTCSAYAMMSLIFKVLPLPTVELVEGPSSRTLRHGSLLRERGCGIIEYIQDIQMIPNVHKCPTIHCSFFFQRPTHRNF